MSHPHLIFSQSDYLIQIVDINSHTQWQAVQIQISWLLQKPTDLDLHCLQKRTYPGSAGQGLKGLTSTCAHSFTINWQLPFLNQGMERKTAENISWSISRNNVARLAGLWLRKESKIRFSKCLPWRSCWIFNWNDFYYFGLYVAQILSIKIVWNKLFEILGLCDLKLTLAWGLQLIKLWSRLFM